MEISFFKYDLPLVNPPLTWPMLFEVHRPLARRNSRRLFNSIQVYSFEPFSYPSYHAVQYFALNIKSIPIDKSINYEYPKPVFASSLPACKAPPRQPPAAQVWSPSLSPLLLL